MSELIPASISREESEQPLQSKPPCMLLYVNALAGGFTIPRQTAIQYIESHVHMRTDHYSDWKDAQCDLCPAAFRLDESGAVMWRKGACQAMALIATNIYLSPDES